MNKKQWICFNPCKDLIAAIITLLLMWGAYYLSQNVLGSNEIASAFVAVLFTMIGLCVVFPVWWSIHVDHVGIKGLRIQKKNLSLSLILSVLLAFWRFLEFRPYISQPAAILVILFNLLAIWEVLFIYGWLFTRYEKCFGKLPAILLTSISVGLYHIGTLSGGAILHLCIVIIVCGIFYALLENIFLLWPIYWAIGTSASTISSNMSFPAEMVVLSAIILLIQVAIIATMELRFKRKSTRSSANI